MRGRLRRAVEESRCSSERGNTPTHCVVFTLRSLSTGPCLLDISGISFFEINVKTKEIPVVSMYIKTVRTIEEHLRKQHPVLCEVGKFLASDVTVRRCRLC
jgi:hypothetical protein